MSCVYNSQLLICTAHILCAGHLFTSHSFTVGAQKCHKQLVALQLWMPQTLFHKQRQPLCPFFHDTRSQFSHAFHRQLAQTTGVVLCQGRGQNTTQTHKVRVSSFHVPCNHVFFDATTANTIHCHHTFHRDPIHRIRTFSTHFTAYGSGSGIADADTHRLQPALAYFFFGTKNDSFSYRCCKRRSIGQHLPGRCCAASFSAVHTVVGFCFPSVAAIAAVVAVVAVVAVRTIAARTMAALPVSIRQFQHVVFQIPQDCLPSCICVACHKCLVHKVDNQNNDMCFV
jgi:hypothetical protein